MILFAVCVVEVVPVILVAVLPKVLTLAELTTFTACGAGDVARFHVKSPYGVVAGDVLNDSHHHLLVSDVLLRWYPLPVLAHK